MEDYEALAERARRLEAENTKLLEERELTVEKKQKRERRQWKWIRFWNEWGTLILLTGIGSIVISAIAGVAYLQSRPPICFYYKTNSVRPWEGISVIAMMRHFMDVEVQGGFSTAVDAQAFAKKWGLKECP